MKEKKESFDLSQLSLEELIRTHESIVEFLTYLKENKIQLDGDDKNE